MKRLVLRSRYLAALLLVALAIGAPMAASAAPVPLVSNAVIIDNAPFYSVGAEDGIGVGNFGLNHPTFIDVPYAVFDFGSVTSVSGAWLNWNFGSLYGGSGPAQITLYVGLDADGAVSTGDRFNGTAIDTFTYSGGEVRNFDVTAYVNASLASGQFFAARLEATVAPGSLNGYYGGNFELPSMEYRDGSTDPVPEPASLLLLGTGIAGLAARRRRKN